MSGESAAITENSGHIPGISLTFTGYIPAGMFPRSKTFWLLPLVLLPPLALAGINAVTCSQGFYYEIYIFLWIVCTSIMLVKYSTLEDLGTACLLHVIQNIQLGATLYQLVCDLGRCSVSDDHKNGRLRRTCSIDLRYCARARGAGLTPTVPA